MCEGFEKMLFGCVFIGGFLFDGMGIVLSFLNFIYHLCLFLLVFVYSKKLRRERIFMEITEKIV